MKSLFVTALALSLAAPAWAAGKVGLGLGAGAAAVQGDLMEIIGGQADAVEIPKAPPKGAKRGKWAKDAQGAQGLTAVIAAEVVGKRLKLFMFVDGKPVSATGANLKGKGLDGAGKAALTSWLKAQLGGGGAVAGGGGGGGGGDDDAGDEDDVVPAPPPAKGKGGGGAGGGGSAVAKNEGKGGPVVAPPPPPPPPSSGGGDSGERVASSEPGEGAARRDGGDDRAIATSPPGRSGDFGGGFLGSALGLAPGMPPLLVVHVDFHSVGRGFSYSDPITTNLRPYSVAFMPTPGVAVEAYPLTFTGASALAGVGLTFGFRTSLGVTSARAQSTVAYPTTYSGLEVGALYRIMLGDGFAGAAIIPSVGWSSTSFALDPVNGTREDQLPNVSYPGVRLGLGFDVPLFSVVRLVGDGAFVIVGSPGEIISTAFFRAGSVNGLAGKVGFSVGFMDHVAAEVGVTYQHFFYAFDPEVGDRFIAGGALDQFVVGHAGVRVDL